VLFLPLWWLLLVALALVMLAFAFVAEILTVIPGFEEGFDRTTSRFVKWVPVWPAWCVTWPELRHEGDADYYRARADKTVADLTGKQLAAGKARKAPPPGPDDIPWRWRGRRAGS
jgi:hypothetical protein